MSKVKTQYKEPQTNAKHSGIGTEVRLREGRGGATQLDDRQAELH